MEKARVRVRAGDPVGRSARLTLTQRTVDSFQNVAGQLGIGTANQLSASTYGFNPITRNRNLLEWAYRGNWVAGIAVDAVAEDMTRAGIEIVTNELTSQEIARIQSELKRLAFWQRTADTIRWGRLYGGAIGVLMVEGQDPSTELRPHTIGRGQFKGIYPMDRWMLNSTYGPGDLIHVPGASTGLPPYYTAISDAPIYGGEKIHHTRCLRSIGYTLPWWQYQTENYWGISILERLYDRMVAFDSTTLGAAQLVNKAHLRTISIEKLRELIAFGGDAMQAVIAQVQFIRMFQTNEGITLLDASDKFEAHQYAFSGLGDMMLQFAQQVAGALQIPLVRLFGQSPAGMNATGESDFRNYYDGINANQEASLRETVQRTLEMVCLSALGKPLPLDTEFFFTPLWQLNPMERSEVSKNNTETVIGAYESGLVPAHVAMEELRANSRVTGMWSSITDQDVQLAQNAPPPLPGGGEGEGVPGLPTAAGGPTAQAGAVGEDAPALPAPVGQPEVADPVTGLLPSDADQVGDDDDGMAPGEAIKVDIFLPNGGEVDVGRTTIQ